jgi:Tol biopolymer transport system component
MSQPKNPAPNDVSPSLVREELDRILASELFTRSERLSAFLRFVVEETLQGRGDGVKEHVIAMAVYGKGTDFSAAADPIVRVDARRLRDKVREYYASAPTGGLIISVPKGSYAAAFQISSDTVVAESTAGANFLRDAGGTARPAVAPPRGVRRITVIGLGAALVGAAVWLVAGRGWSPRGEPASRLLTVTSYPGAEDDPSLSPDGSFIAFAWSGPSPDANADIWIKPVEGDELRQLTHSPEEQEKWPEWSPDGRYIAFTRFVKDHPTIHIVSALGGPERTVGRGSKATWMPDGQALVMVTATPRPIYSLVRHDLETGVEKTLTEAPPGFAESHPRVSPDGRAIAFQRYGAGRSAIFVVPSGGGEARLVGGWVSGMIGGLSWTPDGGEIVYARPGTSGRQLVRMRLDGREQRSVTGVPLESTGPSVSRVRSASGYRLAIVGDRCGSPHGTGRVSAASLACRMRRSMSARGHPTVNGSPSMRPSTATPISMRLASMAGQCGGSPMEAPSTPVQSGHGTATGSITVRMNAAIRGSGRYPNRGVHGYA